ncbi:hypothetical protein MRX96_010225 [Rhipicephalus microplus]
MTMRRCRLLDMIRTTLQSNWLASWSQSEWFLMARQALDWLSSIAATPNAIDEPGAGRETAAAGKSRSVLRRRAAERTVERPSGTRGGRNLQRGHCTRHVKASHPGSVPFPSSSRDAVALRRNFLLGNAPGLLPAKCGRGSTSSSTLAQYRSLFILRGRRPASFRIPLPGSLGKRGSLRRCMPRHALPQKERMTHMIGDDQVVEPGPPFIQIGVTMVSKRWHNHLRPVTGKRIEEANVSDLCRASGEGRPGRPPRRESQIGRVLSSTPPFSSLLCARES